VSGFRGPKIWATDPRGESVVIGRPHRAAQLAAVTLLAATACLAACTGGSSAGPGPTATPTPTYLIAPRTARLSETPVATASAVATPLTFTVMGIRAHLPAMVGTHIEFDPPAGDEYARVRIAVENNDSTFHDVVPAEQVLLLDGGRTATPYDQAMGVARQPDTISLGARDRVEFDLWYALSTGTKLDGLRVVGEDHKPHDITLPLT
jgi:hypothetical protein